MIFVATDGDDASGDGSLQTPYRTLAKGVAIANAKPAGATWSVVLRGGTYREGGIAISRSNVVVQRYEGEHVSLLGSTALSGFTGSGPYTKTIVEFPTGPLNADCADTFPGDPSAQDFGARTAFSVTRQGIPLRRVDTSSVPTTGQYAYDPTSDTLTLADSPDEIEAATQLYAIRTNTSNVAIRGLDVRGYGTCAVNWSKSVGGSVYYKGSILLYTDNPADSGSSLEDSVVANNSGGGVAVAKGRDITLAANAIVNNGWDGVQAGSADGLVIRDNSISYNNIHQWDTTTDAGMKATFIHDGVVVSNLFEHNVGQGFWCDQGCTGTDPGWFVIARNVFRNNDKNGVMYEVSRRAIVASNVMQLNGRAGLFISGSRDIQVWNNTAIDNCESTAGFLGNISVVDDKRCVIGDVLPDGTACTVANGCDPVAADGYDHCQSSSAGPSANTCNTDQVVLMNNLISGSASARPLLNVADPNPTHYGAALLVSDNDYQAYYRVDSSSPTSLIEWQTIAGSASIGYDTLTAYQSALPQREVNSVETIGGTPHPYFEDLESGNYAQNQASPEVWGRGATLSPEVLATVFYPDTSPAQPFPRIGAFEWYGQSGPNPTDGGSGGASGSGGGGASGAGANSSNGGTSAGGSSGGANAGKSPSDDGGCGCRTQPNASERFAWWAMLVLGFAVRRRGAWGGRQLRASCNPRSRSVS